MGKMNTRWAGFTLVEMVVAVGLLSLLSIGLVNSFFVTMSGGGKAQIMAEIKSQGDRIIGSMERSIRSATTLPDCSVPGVITYEVRNDTGSTSTKTYTYSASVESGEKDSIVETKDGVNLGTLSGGTVVVNEVTFVCTEGEGLSPGTVGIHLVLGNAGSTGNTVTQVFDTTVAVRNMK